MHIVEPSFEIINPILEVPEDGVRLLKLIELAGRTCYKSEDRITNESCLVFVRSIIRRGHESVLEHANITARVVCDRGVGNELTRHRIIAVSQESTRFCRYDNEVAFIRPPIVHPDGLYLWENACLVAEGAYLNMLESGETPEIARSVLPLCLKTEIVITANLREWRHIFRVRVCNKAAHPQMRYVLGLGLAQMKSVIPIIFDDL